MDPDPKNPGDQDDDTPEGDQIAFAGLRKLVQEGDEARRAAGDT